MPPAAGSEADYACFLAGSYGLAPDDWQQTVLGGWMGLRADGKWSSPRCGLAVPRQNGKNGALEIRELYGTVELGERFLHTAHEVKTARKAFARLLEFFDNERDYPELTKLVKDIRRTNGQEAIILHNGGGVEFVARSKGSGRGFSVDVLVMDEAQELGEDALAALLPTISASPNPQVIFTGTPPGPKSNGEVFTRTRRAALKGNDRRLCWLEWSCADEPDSPVDLDDPTEWGKANPALGIRLGLETVADERAQFDDSTFGRERLGMWDESGGVSVFGPGKWDALEAPEPDGVTVEAVAVAVSIDLSSSAVVHAARDEAGVLHVKPRQHGPGTDWVVARAVELAERYSVRVVIDGHGPGADLIPELKRAGVDLVVTSTGEVLDACAGFFKAVQDGRLRHGGYPELDAAAAGAVKRDVGDRWAWGRKKSTSDISPLEAATLAVWGTAQDGSPAVWDWPDDL